jgi:hypothetical protein
MAEHDDVFEQVGHDRRQFIKRLAVGSAFAVPVVSSFSMSGVNTVFAQSAEVSGGSGGATETTDEPAVEGGGVGEETTTTSSTSTSTTSTTVGNGGNQPPVPG